MSRGRGSDTLPYPSPSQQEVERFDGLGLGGKGGGQEQGHHDLSPKKAGNDKVPSKDFALLASQKVAAFS